jgi:ribonuclease P protein component
LTRPLGVDVAAGHLKMSLRLGPRVRLRARGEFTLVQKQGRRVVATYMTVLALPNSLDCDRLGIIASRRLGGAVQRNRAKRRLREIFRHQQPDSTVASGVRPLDLVIIPKRELATAPYSAVESDFVGALGRLDRARRR